MSKQEVAAVLGHEITHIANGDMVTLTLLQGIINTFVIFISKILAFVVDGFFRDKNNNELTLAYSLISIVFEFIFGIFASMIIAAYSRRREFAADQGGAYFAGKHSMINALERLKQQNGSYLAANLQAFGIAGGANRFLDLLATHPPIEHRIQALQRS
jgi:heat shock protein HtpX